MKYLGLAPDYHHDHEDAMFLHEPGSGWYGMYVKCETHEEFHGPWVQIH